MVPNVQACRVDRGVPVSPLDADVDRGGGGGGGASGAPRGTSTWHWHTSTRARVSGEPPGAGAGPGMNICHGLEPPSTARAALGGGEAELNPSPDNVIYRDPKSRRVRGRDGFSLPAREGEGGDPQGEAHELEQLAGPLGILGQEVGEALSFWGMGAREGGGVLARRTHAAPDRRQALAVQEDIGVHGLAGVRLLQGGVGDERRQAGLLQAHTARWVIDGASSRRLEVLIGRVRRLRGLWRAEGVRVVIEQASQLGGRALGRIHINRGGGGGGASAAREAPVSRAGEATLGCSPGACPGSGPPSRAGFAAASPASGVCVPFVNGR